MDLLSELDTLMVLVVAVFGLIVLFVAAGELGKRSAARRGATEALST